MPTSFSQRAKQLRRKSFLSFEKLEDRTVMAGNVTAIDASGYLLLFGDGADNQVAITQNANGTLNVAGATGTTINGQSSATLGAATRGALILMGEGNDTLSITGTAASALNIGSSTTIDLGGGNDTLNLSNFGTTGSLTINGGFGNDTINLNRGLNATTGTGAQIGGNLVIQALYGDDSVNIANSSVRYVTVIDENVGNDTADIRNNIFGHVALFIGGAGFDTINNAGNTFTYSPYVLLYETVTAISAPITVNDTATATVGLPTTINVLANDNPNGGTINTGSVVIVQQPLNGTAVVNANGTVTYTPFATTTATTDVFTYTVADTNGNISNVGTVNVSINSPPVIAPIATQTTLEDTPITVPISVSDLQTAVGSLIVSATSSTPGLISSIVPTVGNTGLVITPVADANGTTTITVTAVDAAGATTTQTFTLNVTPVDDLPTITPVADFGAAIGTSPTVNVTVADAETVASSILLTATTSNPLVTATVTAGANGARTVTLSNPTNVTGPVTVTLTADDLTGAVGTDGTESFVVTFSAPPTITFDPLVVGGAPITGAGGTLVINEDTPTTISVVAAPPEAGETITNVTVTSNNPALVTNAGLVYNAGTGTLQITPVLNANSVVDGNAVITVTATDSAGLTTTQTFNLTVTPVNDPTLNLAQVAGTSINTSTQTSISGDITAPVTVGTNLTAATDADGSLTATGVRTTAAGPVTLTGTPISNGTVVLTLNADGTYTATLDPVFVSSVLPSLPSGTYAQTFFVDLFDGTTTTQGTLLINVVKP